MRATVLRKVAGLGDIRQVQIEVVQLPGRIVLGDLVDELLVAAQTGLQVGTGQRCLGQVGPDDRAALALQFEVVGEDRFVPESQALPQPSLQAGDPVPLPRDRVHQLSDRVLTGLFVADTRRLESEPGEDLFPDGDRGRFGRAKWRKLSSPRSTWSRPVRYRRRRASLWPA